MDEREKKAFDFAADLTKQLISLSTGIVTVTLLFSKDITGPKMLAVAAWATFLVSTICGLWVLMALTGTLAPTNQGTTQVVSNPQNKLQKETGTQNANNSISLGNNVRLPSALQILTFGLATVLTLVYVFVAFS
jgi:hypothetical protein